MSGIYIHIPYCRQKCSYCDFHFSTLLKTKQPFIDALKKEISLRKNYLNNATVQTLYFGGGTPSLLGRDELLSVFDTLHTHFQISPDAEVTLEANPDDLDNYFITLLRGTPVNRISIGIQSFCDDDLRFLNRIHSAAEAENAVKRCQDAGFENISIDLIYAIPGMTSERWQENLQKALALNTPHLSAYCLTVEKKTALAALIRKGKVKNVDDDAAASQFQLLMETMNSKGFIHYEISNFCKEGYHSRHNSSYWNGSHYLGFGSSAHSYNGSERMWNVSNNSMYIKSLLEKGELVFESETLDISQRYNEYILTTLRTIAGCDVEKITADYGESYKTHCLGQAEKYIIRNLLSYHENKLFLTPAGKLLADRISADLFIDSEFPVTLYPL